MISYQTKDATGDGLWEILDSEGRRIVVGGADTDAAKAGAPVLVGGVYNATLPDVDDGDAVELAMDPAGRPLTVPGAL